MKYLESRILRSLVTCGLLVGFALWAGCSGAGEAGAGTQKVVTPKTDDPKNQPVQPAAPAEVQ